MSWRYWLLFYLKPLLLIPLILALPPLPFKLAFLHFPKESLQPILPLLIFQVLFQVTMTQVPTNPRHHRGYYLQILKVPFIAILARFRFILDHCLRFVLSELDCRIQEWLGLFFALLFPILLTTLLPMFQQCVQGRSWDPQSLL